MYQTWSISRCSLLPWGRSPLFPVFDLPVSASTGRLGSRAFTSDWARVPLAWQLIDTRPPQSIQRNTLLFCSALNLLSLYNTRPVDALLALQQRPVLYAANSFSPSTSPSSSIFVVQPTTPYSAAVARYRTSALHQSCLFLSSLLLFFRDLHKKSMVP